MCGGGGEGGGGGWLIYRIFVGMADMPYFFFFGVGV